MTSKVTVKPRLAELLFSISAVCRKKGLDPELISRQYTATLREQLSS